jgi:hypothetical protein
MNSTNNLEHSTPNPGPQLIQDQQIKLSLALSNKMKRTPLAAITNQTPQPNRPANNNNNNYDKEFAIPSPKAYNPTPEINSTSPAVSGLLHSMSLGVLRGKLDQYNAEKAKSNNPQTPIRHKFSNLASNNPDLTISAYKCNPNASNWAYATKMTQIFDLISAENYSAADQAFQLFSTASYFDYAETQAEYYIMRALIKERLQQYSEVAELYSTAYHRKIKPFQEIYQAYQAFCIRVGVNKPVNGAKENNEKREVYSEVDAEDSFSPLSAQAKSKKFPSTTPLADKLRQMQKNKQSTPIPQSYVQQQLLANKEAHQQLQREYFQDKKSSAEALAAANPTPTANKLRQNLLIDEISPIAKNCASSSTPCASSLKQLRLTPDEQQIREEVQESMRKEMQQSLTALSSASLPITPEVARNLMDDDMFAATSADKTANITTQTISPLAAIQSPLAMKSLDTSLDSSLDSISVNTNTELSDITACSQAAAPAEVMEAAEAPVIEETNLANIEESTVGMSAAAVAKVDTPIPAQPRGRNSKSNKKPTRLSAVIEEKEQKLPQLTPIPAQPRSRRMRGNKSEQNQLSADFLLESVSESSNELLRASLACISTVAESTVLLLQPVRDGNNLSLTPVRRSARHSKPSAVLNSIAQLFSSHQPNFRPNPALNLANNLTPSKRRKETQQQSPVQTAAESEVQAASAAPESAEESCRIEPKVRRSFRRSTVSAPTSSSHKPLLESIQEDETEDVQYKKRLSVCLAEAKQQEEGQKEESPPNNKKRRRSGRLVQEPENTSTETLVDCDGFTVPLPKQFKRKSKEFVGLNCPPAAKKRVTTPIMNCGKARSLLDQSTHLPLLPTTKRIPTPTIKRHARLYK